MKLSTLKLEDIYWRIKAGSSIRKATSFDVRNELNDTIKEPVFFLSTGRCGTKWFSDLLNIDKSLFVNHAPVPSLAIQSKSAYAYTNQLANPDIKSLLKELFLTAREQHLRYTYKTGKRYVETNNYVTFFAPLLAELFPDAKFVHLVRHPAAFIRSGMRRDYYTASNQDSKRITPLQNTSYYDKWCSFSRLEKIAWLWKETNDYIEQFKAAHSNHITFVFDELNTEQVQKVLDFLEIAIPVKKIEGRLAQKKNKQSAGVFPKYENWKQSDKEKMIGLCKEGMETYKMTHS